MTPVESEILTLTQRLLDSIADGDWNTYSDLCDPTITCVEPEAPGQIVEGLPFHRFYFELGGVRGRHQTTIGSPRIRVVGDVAFICYARMVQKVNPERGAMCVTTMETRVWQKQEGKWRQVHFHRSSYT
jgi:calcium/calmodulin-dependent protein kinase (CaM kinase) II